MIMRDSLYVKAFFEMSKRCFSSRRGFFVMSNDCFFLVEDFQGKYFPPNDFKTIIP